ncbi:hypothetical protein KR222_002502, partial [Zaprionus bogoriensis]
TMAQPENDLPANWNPMAQHFYDKNLNNYESSASEIPAEPKSKKDASSKQQAQHPYLVIRKENKLITETLLTNFFGEALIHAIEYRTSSRIFLVYFHNMCSLEAAWTKMRQFPNIVQCVQGRPKQNCTPFPPIDKQQHVAPAAAAPPAAGELANDVDLTSRTIKVSPGNQKHPEFFKPPIVVKADYTAKDSLLLQSDPSMRYLSVRYEFALEQLQQLELPADQAIKHFRSGRSIPAAKVSAGDSKLIELAKQCFACSCWTDNSCRFCSMPFCNAACFQVLSAVHKKSCSLGKPPVLERISAGVQQLPTLKLPPSGSSVKITCFEQSNVLYVRSAELSDEVAYYKVLAELNMRAKEAPRLTQLPRCGQLVILQLQTPPQSVRAMVLNADNPRAIYVVCVDFGSVEIAELEQLHECCDSLAALPRYAMPVLLRGVPRRSMCPNLRDMMYQLDQNYTFVLKYSSQEYDFKKGMQRVVLVESELNRSLNRLLKTILTPVEPALSDQGLQESYLLLMPVPTGKHRDLVVMDNSFIRCGVLHCTSLELAYEITQLQRDLQHYGQFVAKFDCFAPPKDDLCIAKYQGKWCRGLCMELVGDGHPSILFIDYGNIVATPVQDIRPYPPQFTFPMMTTEFELLGLPAAPSDEYFTRLEQQLAVGAIVNCDEVIYNEQDNNYTLRIAAVQQLQ